MDIHVFRQGELSSRGELIWWIDGGCSRHIHLPEISEVK
jgi:hypothetical protein